MKPRLVIKVNDPFILTVISKGRDVELHHNLAMNAEPMKQVLDMDVVMSLNPKVEVCCHARVEGSDNTLYCKNESAEEMPNGYLCTYHQRYLTPKVDALPRRFVRQDLDLYGMLPSLRMEVAQARSSLTDSEMHDHLVFERLQKVQVDEKVYRRWLDR